MSRTSYAAVCAGVQDGKVVWTFADLLRPRQLSHARVLTGYLLVLAVHLFGELRTSWRLVHLSGLREKISDQMVLKHACKVRFNDTVNCLVNMTL